MFDSHLHFEFLNDQDLMNMSMAGITDIVGATYYPHCGGIKIGSGTIKDLFHRLFTFETARAAANRINLHLVLGINMVSVPEDYEVLLKELPSIVQGNPQVVAIGEIGFEPSSETLPDIAAQENLFRKQVEIAAQVGLPIVCHTPNPRCQKLQYTQRLLDIIGEMGFDFENVIIDHACEETVELIHSKGAWAAVSIQPSRNTSEIDAADIAMKYGVEKLLINSDFSNKLSDALAVPKTAFYLRRKGMSEEKICKLFTENPKKIYRLDT